MDTKSRATASRHGEHDYVTTVRLPIERYRLIKSIGESEQRTFAQQVRFVIDCWLTDRENGQHE